MPKKADRYVNYMLNICYLTGFVREPDKKAGSFLLQQNNNLAQAIPIHVSRERTLPREKTAVTLLCHLVGQETADGGHELVVRAFDIQKPSVRSMPALTTWERGSRNLEGQDDFRPFHDGTFKRALEDGEVEGTPAEGTGFSESEQIMRDILEATRGRLDTRLGDNSNVVMLAGIIDAMAYVQPNEFQREGYGSLLIRQHQDPAKDIPVRLKSHKALAIMKHVSVGIPVSTAGQVRMKVMPNEDGSIKSRNLHVAINDLYQARPGDDIIDFPPWWAEVRDRVVRERQERIEKAKAKPADKPKKSGGDDVPPVIDDL